VLIAGMKAAPNLGVEYRLAFDAIYPRLARKYRTSFYPFFLAGVAGDRTLIQADGRHPNAEGVDVIVGRILPSVRAALNQPKGNRGAVTPR
jgi:acyl-CoA thioesterase-1